MKKIFKNAFRIVCSNLALATPLLVFLLLLNVYLIISKDAVRAIPSAVLFYLTLFLMISAFMAGWFNMIKVAVVNFKKNEQKVINEPFYLMKEFPAGIADYILSYMGLTLLFLLFADILIMSIYHLGMYFIGDIGVSIREFLSATASPIEIQSLIESLSKEQLLKINYWYFYIMFSVQLFMLLIMFWGIELMHSTKDALMAFFYSIGRLFSRPQSILLFICISVLNYIVMIFNYISMFNPFTYFVMTVIYFYFVVYIFVLLFLYYEEKIKSNSDSGTNSNG